MLKIFFTSLLVSVLGLCAAFGYGGIEAVALTIVLAIIEISLSFDNAIVNAIILKDLDRKWRERFLSWGLIIAVFGMRLVFPIILVACATHLNPIQVLDLALTRPDQYSKYLAASHGTISAFGGMFLLMVFLNFIFDSKREVHWLRYIERKLGALGKLESIEVIIALGILILVQSRAQADSRAAIMISGIAALTTYVLIHALTELMRDYTEGFNFGRALKSAGIMTFIYLEVLDASFSFDSVMGAFAITKDIVIIMIGLGIGAFFVRSLTVLLVTRRTLQNYIYLEHGAHYALGALALLMLYGITNHVSEVIIGSVGIILILMSYLSSLRHKNGSKRKLIDYFLRKPYFVWGLVYCLILIYVAAIAWFLYAGPLSTELIKQKVTLTGQPVVVSLTTTPYRIDQIKPTLDSLLAQSIKPQQIFLNIPEHYRRNNIQYEVPEWLQNYPGVTIVRTKDWGPITKLLPTLQQDLSPNTLIVTVDDDHVYPKHMLRDLISYAIDHPKAIVTPMNLQFVLSSDFAVNRIRRIYQEDSTTALVIGAGGVAYRRNFFDNDFINYVSSLPSACYLADDLVISMYFAHKHVPIQQTIQRTFNPIVVRYSYKPQDYAYNYDALSYSADGYRGNHYNYTNCLAQMAENPTTRSYQEAFLSRNYALLATEPPISFWEQLWPWL